MRYLKKFNENVDEQNPEMAFSEIKKEFPHSKVKSMLDEETKEWQPSETDPEFYSTTGNGEAEDVIINQMISWFERRNYQLSEENFEKVKELIIGEYKFLNFNY